MSGIPFPGPENPTGINVMNLSHNNEFTSDLIRYLPEQGIRIFIEFNPKDLVRSGRDPDGFLEEIDKNGSDIYFIRDEERRLFRYNSENPRIYRQIMHNDEYINLLCIKKKHSVFVNLISHSAGTTGGERLFRDTVDYFLEEKFVVHVTLPSEGPLQQLLSQRPVSIDIHPLPFWIREHAPDQQTYLRMLARTLPDLVSGIAMRNPHLLFTNTSVIPQGALASEILGLPHIWRITEFGLPEFGIDYLVEEPGRKQFIVQGSEKIIFASHALSQTYTSYLREDQGVTMLTSVLSLMDKSLIEPFEKKPLLKIICPATIQPGKRQEDLITAVHLLDQKGIQSVLVVLMGEINSGSYEKKLQDQIRDYHLESRVEIRPFTEDLWDKYSDTEMVVSTSVNEGFGRIVAEGMAHGKFVIGTDSGATPELIRHGETGLLYQPMDPEDLAEKILQYINETVDIRRIRQKAFEFVILHCHPEQYRKQIAQLVRETIFNDNDKRSKNDRLGSHVFYRSFLNALFFENKQLSEEVITLKDELAAAVKAGQDLNQNILDKEARKFHALLSRFLKGSSQ